MSAVRNPRPRGALQRARVAAYAAGEAGDTLVEVLVAALMVALIAGAVLTAYAVIGHVSGDQRKRVQAGELAQQDEARMRGLTITQLSGSGGNTSSTVTIDGTIYTVASTARFISGASAGAACTTGPVTSNADEVETTSSVSWSPGNDARKPVAVHGLVTPSEGGSLIVTAIDQAGNGLAGVTASPTGPTTVSALTTDSNGCAVFGGLDGGSYAIAFSAPGYVDVNGNAPASQTVTVIPTTTANAQELQLGQAGTISATFQTTYNGSTVAGTSDQFVAINSGITAGSRTFGTHGTLTNNTYAANVSSGATVYPFTTAYKVYAGGCIDTLTPAAGTGSLLVTPGENSPPASVVLPEAAMIVKVWTGTSASPGSLVSSKPDVAVTDTDAGCGSLEYYPPTAVPTAAKGALVDPGLPYGTYNVCADASISGTFWKNTVNAIADTNYTAGTTVNVYLGTGSGATKAKCT